MEFEVEVEVLIRRRVKVHVTAGRAKFVKRAAEERARTILRDEGKSEDWDYERVDICAGIPKAL